MAGNLLGADLAPAPAYPPYVMPDTLCRVLPRTTPDRTYEILISLPGSYAKEPERKYPVILVTDGYWHFAMVASIAGGLGYGKHIPESIVVGLSYEGENLDFSKMRGLDLVAGEWHGLFEGSSHTDKFHSEKFLDLIETQVLPLMEREYRADPGHRYLAGASAGADFVLFAMLTKPQLFQGYVAHSPFALHVWNRERAFAASGRTVDGRVSISSAGNEWTEYRKWIPMICERLRRDAVVKGRLDYRETPGVRHGAGVAEAFMRGLMYVMEPLAPEKGVATDQFLEPPGKRSFMVSFWIPKTAASPEAVASTRRDHEAFIAKLIAGKRVAAELVDSEYIPDSAGAITLDAGSRAEVVAMVGEDPTIRNHAVEFEVLGD
jgi:predicted alpha/beta superfamily hydrolase